MNAPPLTALLVGVLLIGVSTIGAGTGDSLPEGAATANRTIEVTPARWVKVISIVASPISF
jgi:hypothetical protein